MKHKTNTLILRNLEYKIAEVLMEMEKEDLEPEEYEKLFVKLERLIDLRDKHFKNGQNHINLDSLMVVGGNLVGILAILKYEQLHVLTSRAVQFVLKGRV